MSLGSLLDNSVVHERIPVASDARLTRGAWAGLLLLVVQLGLLHIGRNATDGVPTWGVMSWAFTGFGHADVAFRLTVLALGAAIVGAMITRGFTQGTTIGQRGQLGLMIAGVVAAVPVVWLVTVFGAAAVTVGIVLALGILATVAAIALWAAFGPTLLRFCAVAIPALVRFTVAFVRVTWRITVVVVPVLVQVTVGLGRAVVVVFRPLRLIRR